MNANVYYLLLVLLTTHLSVEGSQNYTTLSFMFVTSFGQFGINSSGVVPAAEMAVRDINNRSNLLPGYVLRYDSVRDSQCQYDRSVDAFFQGIQSAPVKLAIIGCGCSVATEPVAAISHHWNISQIAYNSGSGALSDRTRYKRFFRNSPSNLLDIKAVLSLMEHFRWKRLFSITQDESLFTSTNSNLLTAFNQLNYTFGVALFKTNGDPVKTFANALMSSGDYRIFYVNCYPSPARKIICEASKRGYTYPRYSWIFPDWYPDSWWTAAVDGGSVNCTDKELETFLEKMFIVQKFLSQDATVITDAGITPEQFQEEYKYRAQQGGYGITDAGSRLYDDVWILAMALNRTMAMVKSGNINGTGCEKVPGSLVPLEQFQYSNEMMGCLIQYNIQITNFSGVSGNIQFDSNGTCIQNTLRVKQYKRYSSLMKILFAQINILNPSAFIYEVGYSDQIVYPEGVPPDGTSLQITVTLAVPLVIVLYVLPACGIAFAGFCLVFNMIFRNRKVVKLSSPNLNYLIIVGAISMYISVYVYIIPVTDRNGIRSSCVLREWLFVIGYALCFGSVLAKLWRIYYIFQNPTAKKIVIKDWHMILVALGITAIGVVLLIFGTAVPELRGDATMHTNEENPTGIDGLGVKEEYFIWLCYEPSSPSFYWRILIFVYLLILQIIGIMLAFQTRKVSFPGLNDSVHVAAITYTSSLVLVVLIVDTFVLNSYLNTFGAIFSIGIIILTTVFLALTFIPRVMLFSHYGNMSHVQYALVLCIRIIVELLLIRLLYLLKTGDQFPVQVYFLHKDPEGKSIDSAKKDIVTQDTKKSSVTSAPSHIDQQQVIMELRLENSMLKEKLMILNDQSSEGSRPPQFEELVHKL